MRIPGGYPLHPEACGWIPKQHFFGIHAAHLKRGALSAQSDFRSSIAEIGSRPERLPASQRTET